MGQYDTKRTCLRCARAIWCGDRADCPKGVILHQSRGLCAGCYTHEKRHGNLDNYAKMKAMSRGEVSEEYAFLRSQGCTDEYCADALNFCSVDSLKRTLQAHAREVRLRNEPVSSDA